MERGRAWEDKFMASPPAPVAELTADLLSMATDADAGMLTLIEIMKDVDTKDLENKVKRGMVGGLFGLLETDFGMSPDIIAQMKTEVGIVEGGDIDGLPDFKHLLMLIPGFE